MRQLTAGTRPIPSPERLWRIASRAAGRLGARARGRQSEGSAPGAQAAAEPQADMRRRQERVLSRKYSLLAVASILPLLLVIVALAAFQLATQRQQLLDQLSDQASAHNLMLSNIAKSVRDHVLSLAAWAAIDAAEAGRAGTATRMSVPSPGEFGQYLHFRVTDGGHSSTNPSLIENQIRQMRLGHRAMPYVRWSYVLSGDGGLLLLFPRFEPPRAMGRPLRPDRVESRLRGFFEQRLLGNADPDGDALRLGRWTQPYLDPAGAGWVVANVAPVDGQGEGAVGLVGSAVLLDFLNGFMRAFDYPCGRLWLINEQGQVLAASDGHTGDGLDRLDDVLPDPLSGVPADDLMAPTGAFRHLANHHVLVQSIGATPWRLLFVASSGELNAVVLPRLIPYAVILIGLILTLLLAHLIRQRLVVRPALAFVEYVRAESRDERPGEPALPAVWRPWVEAVAGAFAAKRSALARIRESEQALRESEQRFRTIAEAHPVPVAIVGYADCRLLYASRSFLEQMRIAPEEVPQLTSREWFVRLEERERVVRSLCEQHAVQDFEIALRRRDGSVFPAAVTARPIAYEGEEAAVFGVLDLTELRAAQAEIVRQRDALHQGEKLNALGSLLANVAHELNNPLSVVVGYANVMRDLASDGASRERALKIQGAAERCSRIVKTFLAMARRKPETSAPVRLDRVIREALEVVGYGLRTADIVIELELDPGLPTVSGDPDQLTLVLMNLVVNAQHALQTLDRPRRLTIRTHHRQGLVLLEVADNGPGVPAELVERIFEPFFTTKPQGVGTGVGLSVCRNVVSGHGGEITVASSLEGGALFTIVLPAGTPCARHARRDSTEPAQGAARILVVDDEPEIVQLFAEVLGSDGHEVLVAQSGRQALDVLEAQEIDLIISDLRMPDLDGSGLHAELAARRPDLAARLMFVTGDVLGPESAAFLDRTGLTAFEKPLDPCDLRLKVRTHLARLRAPADASRQSRRRSAISRTRAAEAARSAR